MAPWTLVSSILLLLLEIAAKEVEMRAILIFVRDDYIIVSAAVRMRGTLN